MGGTSYGGNELGHGYEGINISDPTICQRVFTINKLKECLFKEKIILIRSPPMAGKTSLAQLLEKQLLTDCPDMRIIRISLLWMEDDDPNWKFSDCFSWLMRGIGWHQFVAECSHIETVLIVDETGGPRKSNIDEASQHLAQLCDKAFDAEDGANRANQEEIFMLGHLWKGFQGSVQ
ncbi:19609_t:CDS:2 [Entrophospora sp. SA101]|nr:19609_t:CDS:2 [Entrophospora sp. SA101]